MIGRREFLRDCAALAGGVLVFRTGSFSQSNASHTADSRIEVLLSESLGTISPNIYGHFTENLGGVIYDGVWVGPKSPVPNVDGIRKDLIDQLTKIKASVIRFPGGCFADSYNWKDGIGPIDKRPRRTNFWANVEPPGSPASHKYDPNEFGTNEFVHFCKLAGAQPYLAVNLRSLPAESFYQWVEYCNSPAGSTTLADTRAAAGYKEPFDVRYWGVGNESWGCGGDFTGQEYAVEFRRYSTWLPHYGGQELSLIASGPNVDDWNWTRSFLEEIVRKGPGQIRGIFGMALHHYAWNLTGNPRANWFTDKADALQFDPAAWYELLREGERMEGLIDGHWQIMGEFDHDHHIKLVVDEWGPWYRPGSEATPNDILEQTPTLRDAIFSGMTLDIFNRNPEKVGMANCAQLINCLNSLYLAHGDQFVITPVGHVFEMYTPHQGGESVRTLFSSPQVSYNHNGKQDSFWGLKGAASVRGKRLFLTVVNADISKPRETEIALRGANATSGAVTVLTNADVHAYNSFHNKDAVRPVARTISAKGSSFVFEFPAASVSALQIELA